MHPVRGGRHRDLQTIINNEQRARRPAGRRQIGRQGQQVPIGQFGRAELNGIGPPTIAETRWIVTGTSFRQKTCFLSREAYSQCRLRP